MCGTDAIPGLVSSQLQADAILARIAPGGSLSPEERQVLLVKSNETFKGFEITGFVRGQGKERVLVGFKGQSGGVSEGYVGRYGRRLLPTG